MPSSVCLPSRWLGLTSSEVYHGLAGAVGTTIRLVECRETDQRVCCGEVAICIGFLTSILEVRMISRFAYDATDNGVCVDVRFLSALEPGTWVTYTAYCGRARFMYKFFHAF
jgi:hypothetical protein